MAKTSPLAVRWLWSFGKFLAIGYLTICLVLFLGQTRLIFGPSAVTYKTPEALNLRYQEVWLPVGNDLGKAVHLHGWWIPNDRAIATLLYLHGKGGNVSTEVNQAYRFHRLGFSVLLIDYRGYGRSEGGFPTETQVYQDAEAAWNYLKGQRIPATEVILYGHSLGGAIAIDLATRHSEAAGLIVHSAFTSMQAMAARDWKFRLFPIEWVLTQKFDSLRKVRSLNVPVLFIHGTADDLVPVSMAQELYTEASPPKQLLIVENGGHNHADAIYETPQVLDKIRKFVSRVSKA